LLYCTGIYGVSAEVVAKAIVNAVEQFTDGVVRAGTGRSRLNKLRDVRFVMMDTDMYGEARLQFYLRLLADTPTDTSQSPEAHGNAEVSSKELQAKPKEVENRRMSKHENVEEVTEQMNGQKVGQLYHDTAGGGERDNVHDTSGDHKSGNICPEAAGKSDEKRPGKSENAASQAAAATAAPGDPNAGKEAATSRFSTRNEDECAICLENISANSKKLKCGHVYCLPCIDKVFKTQGPKCPTCCAVFGVLTGNQPEGDMAYRILQQHLPGYSDCNTIEIKYWFKDGIQGVIYNDSHVVLLKPRQGRY
jgi:hypothetical protein